MGLINLLNDEVGNFKFYTSKGYTGNGAEPGMKSLKFGKDRPGGGDSGQPYIKEPLLDNPLPESPDFLLRGGLNAPIDAAQDVVRLTKYMFDLKSPSGLLFIAKQNLLSRVASKPQQAGFGLGYAGGALNEGIYTPLSTLAQAGVGFAGIHLNKQGIDPTGLIPGLSIRTYSDYISTQIFTDSLLGGQENSTNRLIKYWDRKITNKNISPNLYTYGGGPGSILGIGETKIRFATDISGNPLRTGVNNSQIPNDFFTNFGYDDYSVFKNTRPLLYQGAKIFNGNTVSGLYETLTGVNPLGINQFNTTNDSVSIENFPTSVYTPFSAGTFPENSTLLGNGSWKQTDFIDVSQDTKGTGIILEDFRAKLKKPSDSSTFLSVSEGYTNRNNIETLFNLGNPGQKGDVSDFITGKKDTTTGNVIGPADKINAYPIYKSSKSYPNGLYGIDSNLDDIIPFYIAILNNEDQTGGPYKKYLHFRAFIDSFSDSYNADWDSLSYMGRAEKFYKYKGFDRKISMAFTVAAQSKQEINGMYDKLNFLASSLAPEYLDSLTSGYMAGNIAYLTLGQYIVNQPGIITSLTYDVPEDSSWDIARNAQGEIDKNYTEPYKAARQLPYMIKVTGFNFIPLHKFRVEKQTFKNDKDLNSTRLLETGQHKYIDQDRPNSDNYDGEFFDRNFGEVSSLPTKKASQIESSNQPLDLILPK